ncbi:ABC transporter substrate-binding protein [Rheinheimera sp.]|uniref:substrate-binding periplasmic protein n=1 Tax=Rheinheimera sp. TaxID=1869214 RepID=UPI002733A678|nr:transporter substrate-binding domain-containing protein [Rheinheimera sp.]MDP2713793.1 transporter substrate-binding domain-containing protein [Rheinheimera sp.]
MLKFYALLFCLVAAYPLQAKQQLRWCVWEFPGNVDFNNKAKQAQGVSVDFMQEIARRAGFELLISKATPPVRCLKELADGSSDLVVSILKTGDGRAGIDYIRYGARQPDRLYLSASDNRTLQQVTELSTMTLAAIRNYGFHPKVKKIVDAMPPAQLIRVNSIYSALEVVAKQRVTAALLPPTQVAAVLQQYPELAGKIKELSFPLNIVEPQPVYIGLAKSCQCPQISQAIQQSLAAMTKDGTIKRILGDRVIEFTD